MFPFGRDILSGSLHAVAGRRYQQSADLLFLQVCMRTKLTEKLHSTRGEAAQTPYLKFEAASIRHAHSIAPHFFHPHPAQTTNATPTLSSTVILFFGGCAIICITSLFPTNAGCRFNAQTWVYPLGVPERAYQLDIIRTALYHNTLVCLPTGLGKTLIAAVVMHNFTRWFPEVGACTLLSCLYCVCIAHLLFLAGVKSNIVDWEPSDAHLHPASARELEVQFDRHIGNCKSINTYGAERCVLLCLASRLVLLSCTARVDIEIHIPYLPP